MGHKRTKQNRQESEGNMLGRWGSAGVEEGNEKESLGKKDKNTKSTYETV